MNTAPFLRYRLQIRPLLPIHVGSGETIKPYEYVLAKHEDDWRLVVLDLGALLADVPSERRAEFERLSERCDFRALRRWLRENADHRRHRRYSIRLAEETYDEILRNLDNPARLGEIHLMPRDAATGRPYLPGSSIKGAIRTAVVDGLARQPVERAAQLETVARQCDRHPQGGARFEAAALGNARPDGRPNLYQDPLRQIAVSDVPLPSDRCYIERIRIIGHHGQAARDPSGIIIYRDVADPYFGEEALAVCAEFRLHHVLGNRRHMARDVLPRAFDVAALCRWRNGFYRPRLEKGARRFVREAELAEYLLEMAGGMNEDQCLIRLGRHSHFECVTVGAPFSRPPRRGSSWTSPGLHPSASERVHEPFRCERQR